MRLSTLPIPLVLSSVALAHFPLGARPGHHDQVARRNEARYPPLVGRQTTADDNGSGNNLLGGLLGETEDTVRFGPSWQVVTGQRLTLLDLDNHRDINQNNHLDHVDDLDDYIV